MLFKCKRKCLLTTDVSRELCITSLFFKETVNSQGFDWQNKFPVPVPKDGQILKKSPKSKYNAHVWF